jgi:hypothetical protein
MEEIMMNVFGPSGMDALREYEQKRDYTMVNENRDILREQLMRGLADIYRTRRHDMYRTMKYGMEKADESCIDVIEMWPYVRRLLDQFVILAAKSRGNERQFNQQLGELMRSILVLYDNFAPQIDQCRRRYTRDLFYGPVQRRY